MKRLLVLLACGCALHAPAQQFRIRSGSGAPVGTSPSDSLRRALKPLNQIDAAGKRHGQWWYSDSASLGEPASTSSGAYNHGFKMGPWYRFNHSGELIFLENFRLNVLHGEARYYELGRVACIGHFQGLNPSREFDTVYVVNPVTGKETPKIVPSQLGTVKHGLWQYFDINTRRMVREEKYQAGELVYRKNLSGPVRDSAQAARIIQEMPHNKGILYEPPKKKQVSYLNYKVKH